MNAAKPLNRTYYNEVGFYRQLNKLFFTMFYFCPDLSDEPAPDHHAPVEVSHPPPNLFTNELQPVTVLKRSRNRVNCECFFSRCIQSNLSSLFLKVTQEVRGKERERGRGEREGGVVSCFVVSLILAGNRLDCN